ncbi:MAG: glycyl-tRNA synthetase, beta subunit [Acidobacteria bacterium]|nr:glycyl-tRNA synthetase, beta subunit [Acidobacteriota bacterium]
MSEYFFELLTEEIPAWMHDAAQATLRQQLAKLVEPLGGETIITVNSTPRRIAFMLAALPAGENDREEEVKGPPRKAAYDAEGNPTKALDGFLKKNDATIDDLLDGGDYIRVRRRIAGRGTGEILAAKIPSIVEGLRWPKMMRWGNGEYSYIRPIHSVISIFDEQPLPISIFGIASGTKTVGHRTLAPKAVDV